MRHLAGVVAVLIPSVSGAAPDALVDGTLDGPMPEVVSGRTHVDLPALPPFSVPTLAGGAHDAQALRVRGRSLLDTDITVKGHVTWIYDCVKDIARPGERTDETRKRIDDDPTQCERAKLHLGPARDTRPEHALWVVDLPRSLKVAVGDYVAITGRFALRSPHGESNSDGLLIYASLAPSTPAARTFTKVTPPKVPALPAITKLPPVKVAASVRSTSLGHLSDGNRAYARKNFAAAITAYTEAVKVWPGNHTAWYGMSGAAFHVRDYKAAVDSARRAVGVAPDVAMYRLWLGRCIFDQVRSDARTRAAAAAGTTPEQVAVSFARENYDAAIIELSLAVQLNPDLWRAHYLLGQIWRDRDYPAQAAEAFGRAIQASPATAVVYVALVDLYRAWDYPDAAIAVAEAGLKSISTSTHEAADLLYQLGAAYDAKSASDRAIAAWTRALDIAKDHPQARFMRGQALFRKKDFAAARVDLEHFVKQSSSGFFAGQAKGMLFEMTVKKP
jgi:tetratricopeptide (TPR) repeat protein